MASERSPVIDYAIIALLLINVSITAYSVLRESPSARQPDSAESKLHISDSQASDLAGDLVKLYNAKDSVALYQKFDSLAKAQLTQEQLTSQLTQLYPVLGTISDTAFSNAVMAGSDGGRDYYHLNYKVRLKGGPFTAGDMRLTVTPREGGFGIMGFYINGTSRPGG
jgi:hypothetical protein